MAKNDKEPDGPDEFDKAFDALPPTADEQLASGDKVAALSLFGKTDAITANERKAYKDATSEDINGETPVVKPVISAPGQVGTTKLDNPDGLRKALKARGDMTPQQIEDAIERNKKAKGLHLTLSFSRPKGRR